jgi:hypothetical protein
LVGWWSAEGNAQDRIGGHNGTLQGGVTFEAGEVGQAFAFHSPTSAVRIAASAALDVGAGDGMTVELWINPDDVTQPAPLVEWNNGTNLFGAHFWVFANQAGSRLQPPSSATAGPAQLYAAFTLLGQWHQMVTDADVLVPHVFQHVALTYDKASGIGRIYRNGVIVAEQVLGTFTPQTAYDVYLGRRPAGPAGDPTVNYSGLMDEVSIYKRALTASEIAAIASAGSAGKCFRPAALDEAFAAVNAAPPSVNKAPLLASLEAIRASIARGNLLAAINQLHAFRNKVQSQVAPVAPTLADQLVMLEQQIVASLDPQGQRSAALSALTGHPMRVQQVTQSDTGLRVQAWALPGTACALQRSTNLRDWQDAGVPVEVEDGVFHFADPHPGRPACFYRLTAP